MQNLEPANDADFNSDNGLDDDDTIRRITPDGSDFDSVHSASGNVSD